MNYYRHYIVILLLAVTIPAAGQSGFYIPKSGKIFFSGDTSTIFSNVINQGKLGVGKNAFVNFVAKSWTNDLQSLITDESDSTTGTGGWIRFLSDSLRQQITGGYNAAIKSGASFPRLILQNRMGVELSSGSAKVRNELSFSKGLLYLKDYTFTVGNRNPGKIYGYDSSRFFVTANKAGGSYLIRENLTSADGRIDFPIGASNISYTPAAIQSHSLQGDDYYVGVFDSVKPGGVYSGNPVNVAVSQGVGKIWEIGKRFRPGADEAEIYLQHLNSEEGSEFNQNKNTSFISWFNGNHWDTGAPRRYPDPGYLTSGVPLRGSGVNSRVLDNAVATPSYFTKLALFKDSSLKTQLWFNARRDGYSTVYVYWNTKPEVHVNYFVVQRMLSNEASFSDRTIVKSLVNGGQSLAQLNYASEDSNQYKGISFYRLKVVNTDSTVFYSNIIAVKGYPGGSLNLIWPNPTTDVFYVSCDPVWKLKTIVIWNALGQKVKEEEANGRTIIKMSGLRPGTYFVGLIRESQTLIETKKLIVLGK